MGAILEGLARTVGDEGAAARVSIHAGETGLTARLRAGELALDSVSFFAAQAARLLGLPAVDVSPPRVGVNFSSYNYLSVDGVPAAAWAPLSGFFEAADGWVRTHANYPHHRARLCAAFGLDDSAGRDEFAEVLATLPAADAEALALARGALCVRVRTPEEFERLIPRAPLLDWAAAPASGRPVAARAGRPRVLDFSRVIAGPTCTRALALLGADVLRIDPPEPAEIPVQHIDTGAGKRSAVLDLGQHAERIEQLLAGADVVVLGYRPGSLARFGLDEQALRERHPHLVIATLSAYPPASAWAVRRGFDSLVQAASGIAVAEGRLEAPIEGRVAGLAVRPGALRAQALDHATGYVLAGAICAALADGVPATVRSSLAAAAQELLALGPSETGDAPLPVDDVALASELETVQSDYGVLRRARAIIDLPGRVQGPVALLGSARPEWVSAR
ncbi:CoA transferase [Microterricola pindariensis]|uniref:CoA transferase n=1 Tax=Microterricola pindariensis TaxID=478010 RepID=UPI000CEBB234|nr:CoA transferase [Microterricola pindariensis]